MNAVIAIPCYQEKMSRAKKESLIQCGKVFGTKYDVIFFAPERLECSAYLEVLPNARTERFDDKFFASVSTYSWLLTPEFYLRFRNYEYMLIYQLDAWAFCDKLEFWCKRGYDYIGAHFVQKYGNAEQVVAGNGGFSLRRISAMLGVLEHKKRKMSGNDLLKAFFKHCIAQGKFFQAVKPLLRMLFLYPNNRANFLNRIRHKKSNSEDMFFYLMSRKFTSNGLTMPDVEEAALFSLDTAPARFFLKLLFGCHAWTKESASFWKGSIPALTEEIKGE